MSEPTIQELHEQVSSRPRNGAFRHRLSVKLQELGEMTAAVDQAVQAIERSKPRATYYQHLAALYLKRKNPILAEMTVRHAMSIGLEDQRLHVRLAQSLMQQRDMPAALTVVDKAIESLPDHDALIKTRDQILEANGTKRAA